MPRIDITDFYFSRKLMTWLGRGLTKCLYVYHLSDFDVPLTKIRGSDNIFVAAVSPEELLQGREREVSL